jgi:hypothetical protein
MGNDQNQNNQGQQNQQNEKPGQQQGGGQGAFRFSLSNEASHTCPHIIPLLD